MQEIMTVAEAAAYIRKHPTTIRRWIISKKLKARKVAAVGEGVYVLLKTDVLEFAVSKMVKDESRASHAPKPTTPPSSGQETLPI